MIAGIDEAGRGPLIGPLVVALCACPDPQKFVQLGVADSKHFGSGPRARHVRARLCRDIMAQSRVFWVQIEAHIVDEFVLSGVGLNVLERQAALRLLQHCGPVHEVYADGKTLFSPLQIHFSHLHAQDKADVQYPVVAAASIVAKTLRDFWMERYETHMASMGFPLSGGGYPNAATMDFVKRWKSTFGNLPPHVRQSWRCPSYTVENLF